MFRINAKVVDEVKGLSEDRANHRRQAGVKARREKRGAGRFFLRSPLLKHPGLVSPPPVTGSISSKALRLHSALLQAVSRYLGDGSRIPRSRRIYQSFQLKD